MQLSSFRAIRKRAGGSQSSVTKFVSVTTMVIPLKQRFTINVTRSRFYARISLYQLQKSRTKYEIDFDRLSIRIEDRFCGGCSLVAFVMSGRFPNRSPASTPFLRWSTVLSGTGRSNCLVACQNHCSGKSRSFVVLGPRWADRTSQAENLRCTRVAAFPNAVLAPS